MARANLKGLRDEGGAGTVGFVAMSFFFFLSVLFVLEASLAIFWWKATEKAAQLGARAAVVSSPVATGLPDTIQKTSAGTYGVLCRDASNPCIGYGPASCIAGTTDCDAAQFARVFGVMDSVFGVLEPEHVTITYEDIGLGFAGGPLAPLVTVTLSGVPFQTGFISIIGNMLGTAGNPLVVVPNTSAALTAEDLNTGGV